MAVSEIGAGRGAEAGHITEDGQVLARGPWLDNSGKRGQAWPLRPGLPKSKTLVSVLKQELRLEIFAADSTLVGRGALGAGRWGEEHDSLFQFLDQNICSCRYLLLVCGQS